MTQTQEIDIIQKFINCHNMDCENIAAIIHKYSKKTSLEKCWFRYCEDKKNFDYHNDDEINIIDKMICPKDSHTEYYTQRNIFFDFLNYCSKEVKTVIISYFDKKFLFERTTIVFLLSMECLLDTPGMVEHNIHEICESFSRETKEYCLLLNDARTLSYLVGACGGWYEEVKIVVNNGVVNMRDVDWDKIKKIASQLGLWCKDDGIFDF